MTTTLGPTTSADYKLPPQVLEREPPEITQPYSVPWLQRA